MPLQEDFIATRNATWGVTLPIPYEGRQLSPIDHIAMQVRVTGGATDPALLTCNPISYRDDDNGDGTRTITLFPLFTETELDTLPAANGIIPQKFYHDIRITYQDGLSEILCFGAFIIYPGVTTI